MTADEIKIANKISVAARILIWSGIKWGWCANHIYCSLTLRFSAYYFKTFLYTSALEQKY